jgi:ketosteroid isomerase-like protein
MPSDNVELLRRFYDAANRGDPEALQIFAPDAEFHMPEVLPHGGTIRGREAIGGYFYEVQQRWDGFRAQAEEFIADGDRVVVLGRFLGRPKATGQDADVPFALVWRIEGGQAVRVEEYTDTAMLLKVLAS